MAAILNTGIDVAFSFVPIPGAPQLGSLVQEIIALCDSVKVNKRIARKLSERCDTFQIAFEKASKNAVTQDMKDTAGEAQITLTTNRDKMRIWAQYSFWKSLVKYNEISNGIGDCYATINECLDKFNFAAHDEIITQGKAFQEDLKRDHAETLQNFADVKNTVGLLALDLPLRKEAMETMQNRLGENKEMQEGLAKNLAALLEASGGILPNLELSHGEVARSTAEPIALSPSVDLMQGIYLRKEVVSLKRLRNTQSDSAALKHFVREAKLWGSVLEVDQGQYIVPFYGYVRNDGPFPYLVARYMPDGNAIDFVQAHPEVDHRALIRDIAQGLRVLHSMEPEPIAHGNVRGANVMIRAGTGTRVTALLADFGLSKIVADVAVPFSITSKFDASYRWFAPELTQGDGTFTVKADIYAWSMTVLELITHSHPWRDVKHTNAAAHKAANGERPPRPAEPEVVERGLDDHLWELMTQGWSQDYLERPDISQVLAALPV
ncbi:hypothetical protein JAAARDRAFT_201996 [Jaapia argillacea MUCL 33604]|uniref:Protein kinase domain-containing protein n=1 Tax=Jaapia argillacea MUCL 33604 TaxID=933084 RepID=A0A067QME2_9AGAM|nr:hypothetical protein JAAARDRAFT_201996 [Jaapia argillacea MUCL 33604]